jgi:hypothetical protein
VRGGAALFADAVLAPFEEEFLEGAFFADFFTAISYLQVSFEDSL